MKTALPANLKSVNLPELDFDRAPWQSERVHGNGVAVRLIIVHTPEGSFASTRATLFGKERKVSYHCVIRKDGKTGSQFVPWSRKAWHAGTYNSASDGIAMEGFASATFPLDPVGRACARAVAMRLLARDLPARWSRDGGGSGFCRHADIQADRKDPMTLARWATFVALVKFEYSRGKFRASWGTN